MYFLFLLGNTQHNECKRVSHMINFLGGGKGTVLGLVPVLRLSLVALCGLVTAVASLVVEHKL